MKHFLQNNVFLSKFHSATALLNKWPYFKNDLIFYWNYHCCTPDKAILVTKLYSLQKYSKFLIIKAVEQMTFFKVTDTFSIFSQCMIHFEEYTCVKRMSHKQHIKHNKLSFLFCAHSTLVLRIFSGSFSSFWMIYSRATLCKRYL